MRASDLDEHLYIYVFKTRNNPLKLFLSRYFSHFSISHNYG